MRNPNIVSGSCNPDLDVVYPSTWVEVESNRPFAMTLNHRYSKSLLTFLLQMMQTSQRFR